MENPAAGYIVRSLINRALILCTNGEWKPENMVGPGGFDAKVYKTKAGALKVRGGNVIVESVSA
jgi:hypothetical protein